MGCIFAELLQRSTLWKGENELDQLGKILATLGVPTADDWPEFDHLYRGTFRRPPPGAPTVPVTKPLPAATVVAGTSAVAAAPAPAPPAAAAAAAGSATTPATDGGESGNGGNGSSHNDGGGGSGCEVLVQQSASGGGSDTESSAAYSMADAVLATHAVFERLFCHVVDSAAGEASGGSDASARQDHFSAPTTQASQVCVCVCWRVFCRGLFCRVPVCAVCVVGTRGHVLRIGNVSARAMLWQRVRTTLCIVKMQGASFSCSFSSAAASPASLLARSSWHC
jgi:hypothetical protein